MTLAFLLVATEDIPELKLPKDMMYLAGHIVSNKSGHFDPSHFEDRYENASRADAYGIPVASERRFLEWIGKAVPDTVHKTYPVDQIAALSHLSGDMIRELTQFGLLDERDG